MRDNVLYAFADEPPFHSELEALICDVGFGVIPTRVKTGVCIGSGLCADRLAASVALKLIVVDAKDIAVTLDWMHATKGWVYCDPSTVVVVTGFRLRPYSLALHDAGAHRVVIASKQPLMPLLRQILEDVSRGRTVRRAALGVTLQLRTSILARNMFVSAVNVLST